MTDSKAVRRGATRTFDRLRDVWRDAEDWPLAGSAVRRVHDAESRALSELKQRLDALDAGHESAAIADDEAAYIPPESPSRMLADLLVRGRSVDPDLARDDLYRRILGRLVPDEVGMLRVLATRQAAPLCHIGGSRLPAGGTISVMHLRNATSLGQAAGVLLREYTPYYMTQLLDLGLATIGAERDDLAADYELLLADTHVRRAMDTIRHEHRLYPRVGRHSVSLSPLGRALWRDCFPAAEALSARHMPY
ncbi:hypothetical protein [Salinisphaera sp. Q1T1-3]|uniref:Abi-alpha family protein n=1 Tax=Salinisphaera sp. Q1T1-3 TaxID=2321229 RepID=UPI000E769D73|nr:hypothetical protein [Salinisphaera sp. Q1T1-3]RJS91955.1 hypothetical protein D3260_13500 [Salinisphaera sp. Q1T1-3]